MRKNILRTTALVCAALLGLTVAGCGDKKKEDKKIATQIAAKVDSEEISVHQINQVLSKAQGVPPERVGEAKREILNRLVDQQVAVNKAVEQKLDRNPEIMMAIEAARREILSRAYLEKFAGTLPKPTPEEIKKYYAEHPQLFAQRRLYNIQELAVQPQEGLLPQLQEKAASAKSLEEVVNWLKAKSVKFTANAGARAAEQIPLELLPKLHETKDGQTIVTATPQAILVMKVVASQSSPVSEEAAAPRITQFLMNRKASEAVAAEIKQLKEKAKVEYVGEFSKPAEPVSQQPAAAAPTPSVPGAASAPASSIEKGAAGLK